MRFLVLLFALTFPLPILFAQNITNGRLSVPQKLNVFSNRSEATGPSLQWDRLLATYAVTQSETATDAVIDKHGNAYITGFTKGPGTDADFVTVKIDTAGKIAWISRHDGPFHGRDEAWAIAADSVGNTYVSGWQNGLDHTLELMTIKLSSNGVEEWHGSYQCHADHFYSTRILVDPRGAVTTAGPWQTKDAQLAVYVVHYAPDGTQQWALNIDTSGYVSKMLCDDEKNIYLACLYGAIVKIDSTGKVVWKRARTGMIYDAVLTDDGNLILTGGNALGYESAFSILKINRDGDTLWQDQDISPQATWGYALAGTPGGGCYVCALTIYGGTNIIIRRYDASGQRMWSYTYDSFVTGNPSRAHLSIGKNGNLFVGATNAYNDVLIRMSPQGERLGATDVQGALFIRGGFDNMGNYVAAGAYKVPNVANVDYAVGLITADGALRKIVQYEDTSNTFDVASGMVRDPGGSVFACTTSRIGLESRPSIWKVDPDGVLRWQTSIEDTTVAAYQARGINRDPFGNLVMISDRHTPDNKDSAVICKIDNSGKILWTVCQGAAVGERRVNVPFFDIDELGCIYFTDSEFRTHKIDQAGKEVWSRQFAGSTNSTSSPVSLRLAKDGGVCVAGTNITNDYHSDFVLLRYDRSGNLSWQAPIHVPADVDQTLTNILLDDSSNVFATGRRVGGRGADIMYPTDFVVSKTSSRGLPLWSATHDTTSVDEIADLCFDSRGNVLLAGSTSMSDFALLKYDTAGKLLWSSTPLNFPTIGWDIGCYVCCDKQDNIYLVGWNFDGLELVKYSGDGIVLWSAIYQGSYYGEDHPAGIITDAEDNLYILEGSIGGSAPPYYDYSLVHLIKIETGNPTGTKSIPAVTKPLSDLIVQCWPNPFNGSTTISYCLGQRSHVSVQVFNMLGQRVAAIVDGIQPSGDHFLRWNADRLSSGMYFCRIDATTVDHPNKRFVDVKKMILVK